MTGPGTASAIMGLTPTRGPKVLICIQVRPGKQRPKAKVAELVDALDLGSSGETRESSSLSFRTSLLLTVGTAAGAGFTLRIDDASFGF